MDMNEVLPYLQTNTKPQLQLDQDELSMEEYLELLELQAGEEFAMEGFLRDAAFGVIGWGFIGMYLESTSRIIRELTTLEELLKTRSPIFVRMSQARSRYLHDKPVFDRQIAGLEHIFTTIESLSRSGVQSFDPASLSETLKSFGYKVIVAKDSDQPEHIRHPYNWTLAVLTGMFNWTNAAPVTERGWRLEHVEPTVKQVLQLCEKIKELKRLQSSLGAAFKRDEARAVNMDELKLLRGKYSFLISCIKLYCKQVAEVARGVIRMTYLSMPSEHQQQE